MPMTTRAEQRLRRHQRLRARVRGTAARPRLSVFRSTRHLGVQLIDDNAGRTLLGLSDHHLPRPKPTRSKKGSPADAGDRSRRVAWAFAVGSLLAERAQQRGISRVVFDRGGYTYHGQVQAVADGARAGGLQL